ncbi:MAG: winged helix-turn-helix domain-containing protein [Candidatus Altiarchaeota archaeon]
MSDKITLDRETFKALAADTRIDILKRIEAHKLTLTDLSEQMSMSPSTIKEHLDRLVEVGLIEQDDRGMKWKYYHLTSKGRNILTPQETKVWIMLGTTLLVLAGSAFTMLQKLSTLLTQPSAILQGVATEEMADASMNAAEAAPRLMMAAGAAANETMQKAAEAAAPTTLMVQNAVESVTPSLPWLEMALVVASLIAAGACIGYLMKKRI